MCESKRFTIVYNEQSKMMQYVDNKREEPNKWAVWNASQTCQLLNEMNDKIIEQIIQLDFLQDENSHMRTVLEENKRLKAKNNKLAKLLQLRDEME